MELVFVPAFMQLWHTAWGLAIAARLQVSRLGSAPTRQLPPLALNTVFMLGLIACPSTMTAASFITAQRWNKGYAAFAELSERLLAAEREFATQTTRPSTQVEAVQIVIDGVPSTQQLLDRSVHCIDVGIDVANAVY
jgi:hypothetical protein